jgi:hypothetical protein
MGNLDLARYSDSSNSQTQTHPYLMNSREIQAINCTTTLSILLSFWGVLGGGILIIPSIIHSYGLWCMERRKYSSYS